MECPAVSTSKAVREYRACRGEVSAPEQGALAEKKFAPAGTEPSIPRIPHIPRKGRPNPAGAGNVGKEGKHAAASRPVQDDLGQDLVGLGAQMP
jgi:hypothetical protein